MQRDLQITPRRLEYTREKEGELFTSLMTIANRKQEEMKDMIVETLGSMKEQLLEDAANLEFTGKLSNTPDQSHTRAEVWAQPSADQGSGFRPASSYEHVLLVWFSSSFPQSQSKNSRSIECKLPPRCVCVRVNSACEELVTCPGCIRGSHAVDAGIHSCTSSEP